MRERVPCVRHFGGACQTTHPPAGSGLLTGWAPRAGPRQYARETYTALAAASLRATYLRGHGERVGCMVAGGRTAGAHGAGAGAPGAASEADAAALPGSEEPEAVVQAEHAPGLRLHQRPGPDAQVRAQELVEAHLRPTRANARRRTRPGAAPGPAPGDRRGRSLFCVGSGGQEIYSVLALSSPAPSQADWVNASRSASQAPALCICCAFLGAAARHPPASQTG